MISEIELDFAKLKDDSFWETVPGVEARLICESARKSVQLELSLLEQDKFDYKAIPREPEEFRAAMSEFGARRRRALVFLNLVEQRQSALRLRKIREVEWAVVAHRQRTLRDDIEPTQHDIELWELVRDKWR